MSTHNTPCRHRHTCWLLAAELVVRQLKKSTVLKMKEEEKCKLPAWWPVATTVSHLQASFASILGNTIMLVLVFSLDQSYFIGKHRKSADPCPGSGAPIKYG